MELRAAIKLFIDEFSAFETHIIGAALRALSADEGFLDGVEKLLDLEARLNLLRRMALSRGADPALVTQLDDAIVKSNALREKRNTLTRWRELAEKSSAHLGPHRSWIPVKCVSPLDVWVPTVGEIDACIDSTYRLKTTMRSVSERLNQPDRRRLN